MVRQMAELPGTSSRQWWTLALVCTAAFMLLLDITAPGQHQRAHGREEPAGPAVGERRLCPGAGRAAAAGGHPG